MSRNYDSRVQEIRLKRGLKCIEVARAANKMDPSTYNRIDKGNRGVSPSYKDAIAKSLDVPVQELFAPIGSPIPATASISTANSISNTDTPKEEPFITVPQYDVKASAGTGELVENEAVVGEWHVPYRNLRGRITNPKNVTVITVAGDSMEPEYRDGDLVFVDLGYRSFTHDGVYVLDFGYGLVIKHLQPDMKEPGCFLIVSQNPIYKDQSAPASELHIKGRVIGRWDWR